MSLLFGLLAMTSFLWSDHASSLKQGQIPWGNSLFHVQDLAETTGDSIGLSDLF